MDEIKIKIFHKILSHSASAGHRLPKREVKSESFIIIIDLVGK